MPGRDPSHWLHRFSPEEWLRAATKELGAARDSMGRHSTRPALASLRRAAGMGWNAVLALEPELDGKFGRTYAEHLQALADGVEPSSAALEPLPPVVRDAARMLMRDPAAGSAEVVQILTKTRDARLLDAAETVVAEAYARVIRRAGA
ncbi:MAG: hypothetical protein NVS3B10_15120 [Polyangiales bacterium]